MAVLKTTSPVVLPFAPTETPRNTVPSSRASTAGVDTPVPRFALRAFRRCAKREALIENGLPLDYYAVSFRARILTMRAITVHGPLADNLLHAVKPGRLAGQALGRPQGAAREGQAIGGPVGDFDALAEACKADGVLADDISRPQCREIDIRQ